MGEVLEAVNLAALSQIIQKTWPFGVSDSSKEDDDKLYLKAYLSNNIYTVIKASRSNTVQEAMEMIAEKKNVPLDGYLVKIVTSTSRVDVTDTSRPLSDFNPIGLILFKSGGSLAADVKPPMRAGRRGSIVVAPKGTHIRKASQEFPKMVLDNADQAEMVGKTPEYTTSYKSRKRSLTLLSNMFRRDHIFSDSSTESDDSQDGTSDFEEDSRNSLPISHEKSESGYTDGCPIPDSKSGTVPSSTPSVRLPEVRKPSLSRHLSMKLFRRDQESSNDRNSGRDTSKIQENHKNVQENNENFHDSPVSLSSSSSPPNTESPAPSPAPSPPNPESPATCSPPSDSESHLPDPNAEPSLPEPNAEPDPDADVDALKQRARPPLLRSDTATSIATLNRKRTNSSTTPSSPVHSHATLRRSTFRSRSRTQSSGLMPSDLEAAGVTSRAVSVTYPDGTVSVYKLPETATMETLLQFSCTVPGNMDVEKYTFETLDTKVNVEMDRNLHFYVAKDVTSFVIVEREKEFSLKWVAEGDQDTMVLQMVGGEWLVMAATEQKLIERMTDGEIKTDMNFIDTLLLTYRSFMTPAEFFDQLVCRFNAELPPDPTPEDIEYFEKMKGSTQEKCMTVFSWWIEYHIQDFTNNDELREELRQVLLEISEYPWFEKRAQDMNRILEIKTKEYEVIYDHILRSQVERKGKTMDSSLVQDLSAEELAQQLCIHDFLLFRNIPAIEYLNQIWRRPNDEETLTCPSLDYFIARFDKESYWVATEVCCVKDKKKRIHVLEKFIMTAKLCQTNGNFFTMFALIAGLSLNSVSRLKKTFDGLSKTAKATVEELEKLADPSRNMKNYRDCLARTKPPIVPFLPIYLKDLTFINDGNQSKIFTNMINFDKLRMMARRVHDITDMTKVEYTFSPKPIVQNFLNKPPIEKDSQKLKEMSLDCERKK